MRTFKAILAILPVATLLSMPTAVWAQEQASQDQRNLTLQDVKDRLKQNEKYIQDASQHGKAGDAKGTQVALDNYSRSMEGLNRAIAQGQFEGDEFARVEALERVEMATRKNGEVLAGLLDKVPEEAKPRVQNAMEVSQTGRTTVLGQLNAARAQRDAAVSRRRQSQQSGGFGGPSAAGSSGGGRPGGAGGGRR